MEDYVFKLDSLIKDTETLERNSNFEDAKKAFNETKAILSLIKTNLLTIFKQQKIGSSIQ